MKRLTVLFAVIFMAGIFAMNTQAQQETDINMSMTVDEYIEAVPEINFDLGETSHSDDAESVSENNLGGYQNPNEPWDIAYANCPFNVTVEGNNPAGDGRPIFARKEVGDNATGWDRLPSHYRAYIYTNDEKKDLNSYWDNSGEFPLSQDYAEAPHDGQVGMALSIKVNSAYAVNHWGSTVPVRKTLIDPNMTPEESADAGLYEANLKVTFSAL